MLNGKRGLECHRDVFSVLPRSSFKVFSAVLRKSRQKRLIDHSCSILVASSFRSDRIILFKLSYLVCGRITTNKSSSVWTDSLPQIRAVGESNVPAPDECWPSVANAEPAFTRRCQRLWMLNATQVRHWNDWNRFWRGPLRPLLPLLTLRRRWIVSSPRPPPRERHRPSGNKKENPARLRGILFPGPQSLAGHGQGQNEGRFSDPTWHFYRRLIASLPWPTCVFLHLNLSLPLRDSQSF